MPLMPSNLFRSALLGALAFCLTAGALSVAIDAHAARPQVPSAVATDVHGKTLVLTIAGGVSDAGRQVLSVGADGSYADLWSDDKSGRQRWRFQRSADGESYNILVGDGVDNGRVYLSVKGDGSLVDLWHQDDGSGRQRWLVQPQGDGTALLRIKGGVVGDRVYLSVKGDGSLVDLWNRDDGSGRQRWRMTDVTPRVLDIEGKTFALAIAGGVNDAGRKMLSVGADGSYADLWTDDASGRQHWRFQRSADGESYNILVGNGVGNGRDYLSVKGDGSLVDLWHEDDGSGRQRWLVEPQGDGTALLRIKGGVTGGRVYLSVSGDGKRVDLWNQDDGSGRQRWRPSPR